jgi:hypothetical protein
MPIFQINQLPTIPQAPADADVLAIEVNGITYKVSKQALADAIAAGITPANIGALPTSGGTMNGSINMGQSGSSDTSQNIVWVSEDGTRYYLRTYANQLQLARQPSGDSPKTILNCYADGTIGLGSPSAWRSALGLVLASGSYTFSNLAAGAQTSTSIAFSSSIGTTNYIVVTQSNVSRCAIGIQNRTATGFELYCRNVSSETSSPIVTWAVIALG